MTLTKIEDIAFVAQTVTMSGNAFRRCSFSRCTLIVRDLPFILEGCRFENCNWRIECDILWGEPNIRSRLRQILDLIDGAADAVGPQGNAPGPGAGPDPRTGGAPDHPG